MNTCRYFEVEHRKRCNRQRFLRELKAATLLLLTITAVVWIGVGV